MKRIIVALASLPVDVAVIAAVAVTAFAVVVATAIGR
jgi:hypothetical protein